MVDLFTTSELFNKCFKIFQNGRIDFTGFRKKYMTRTNLLPGQAFGNVLLINMVNIPTIFFTDFQLTVSHFKAGLDFQQIGAESSNTGAAAAFPHKFEGVQHKACRDLASEIAEMYGYIKGTHPSITTLSGLNGKQTDTGGEHHAVNNIDTAQL